MHKLTLLLSGVLLLSSVLLLSGVLLLLLLLLLLLTVLTSLRGLLPQYVGDSELPQDYLPA